MSGIDDDELEEALGDLIVASIEKSGGLDIDRLAERILAAGWRPPARIIDTDEELDALPGESLLRFADGCITGPGAVYFGGPPALPAILLWEPGDGDE